MDQDDTRRGPRLDGMDGSLPELHSNLLGLHVRLTVQCPNHGSHTATMTGPFLEVVDAVHLFRQVSASQDRWVISEYRALDYVPECTVSEWE